MANTHKDMLGRSLHIGDYVAFSADKSETLQLATLKSLVDNNMGEFYLNALNSPKSRIYRRANKLMKLDAEEVKQFLDAVQPPKDKLGRELKVGDYALVAPGDTVTPYVGKIGEIVAAGAVRITKVLGQSWKKPHNAEPKNLIKVDEREIMMFKLSEGKRGMEVD